jgi:hypothetical protein
MKRTLSAALVAALAASLTFGGLAAAKDHPNQGKGKEKQRTEQVQPRGNAQPAKVKPAAATVAPSLRVKGNASHPGSVFRVLAVLKSARDARPDTIDAVVHFATGDLAVELTRSGGGAAYHAFVPVPDDEPEGTVVIDATADVDGETVEATGSGKILVRGNDEAEATQEEGLLPPDASPSTEASESPETCEPEASPSTEPSQEPSDQASEEPSDDPSAEPSNDPSNDPSDDPSADPSADPSESPDADQAADEGCTEAPAFQLTKDMIVAVLEYLQSIFV